MEKILVSACLLGDKTRYDGKSNKFAFLDELSKKYELVPFCPEVEAGLAIPRSPAEIVRNEVINKDGENLTKLYNESAEKAYRICLFLGIKIAILKDGSPSCGPRKIANGKFDGTKIDGLGVTARYLISKRIKVYCENDNLEFLLKEKAEKKRRSPIKKEENRYSAKAIAQDDDSEKILNKGSRFSKDTSLYRQDIKESQYEKKRRYKGHSSARKGYDDKGFRKQKGSSSRDNASFYGDKGKGDKPYYKKKGASFHKGGDKKGFRSHNDKNSSKASYKGRTPFAGKRNRSSSYKSKKRSSSFKKEG